jgi:hypothetical protein
VTPKERAIDVGRTIQQFNPLRTAITWTVLVFITGTSLGMFVRSPMAAVKRANAAQDSTITKHTIQIAAHDTTITALVKDIPLIKCYVKALYAGESEPSCGLK